MAKLKRDRHEPTGVMVGPSRTIKANRCYREWPKDLSARPNNPHGKPMVRYLVVSDGQSMLPELAVASTLAGRYDWWAWYDRWFNHAFRQTMYGSGEAIKPPRWVLEALARIWVEAGGSVEGMWDGLGVNRDGGIEFCEAKRYGGRDRLNDNQHRFAAHAHAAFGDRATFTVFEWDFAPPHGGSAMRRPTITDMSSSEALP